jgi:hypothetical protein
MAVYSQWICRIQKTGGQISHIMQLVFREYFIVSYVICAAQWCVFLGQGRWYYENIHIVSYVMYCKLGAVVCVLRAREA